MRISSALILGLAGANAETRAAMLASGMEHGMEASYVRLEAMNQS